MENPFTPNFGQVPLQMAGREQIITKMQKAFESNGNNPNLCSIFVGARGTGKTALLQLLAEKSESLGWISVSAASITGMLEDVYEQTLRKTKHLIDSNKSAHVKQISLGRALTVEIEHPDAHTPNWRSRMSDVLDSLSQLNTGLLIAIDEVDPTLDEIVRLVTVYQLFIGEGRKVSLLMAGLPHRISTLLNGKSISFLRRANRLKLGRINDADVKSAFAQTLAAGGKTISENALKRATQAIDGFPFMMQLLGFYAWDFSTSTNITQADITRAQLAAKEDMEQRVLQATFAELSDRDIEFLCAMLEDKQLSRTTDIASRISMTTGNVSTYKKRLLEQGIIEEVRRGEVKFAMPYIRDYLDKYYC